MKNAWVAQAPKKSDNKQKVTSGEASTAPLHQTQAIPLGPQPRQVSTVDSQASTAVYTNCDERKQLGAQDFPSFLPT
jgi:hypothetical protein